MEQRKVTLRRVSRPDLHSYTIAYITGEGDLEMWDEDSGSFVEEHYGSSTWSLGAGVARKEKARLLQALQADAFPEASAFSQWLASKGLAEPSDEESADGVLLALIADRFETTPEFRDWAQAHSIAHEEWRE